MSTARVPRLAIIDDPLAGPPATDAATGPQDAVSRVQRPQPSRQAATVPPGPENASEPLLVEATSPAAGVERERLSDEETAVLFARLPRSLVWELEAATFELTAADPRHRKVTRQELAGALLYHALGAGPGDRDTSRLAELLTAYRGA